MAGFGNAPTDAKAIMPREWALRRPILAKARNCIYGPLSFIDGLTTPDTVA
jgi:hypothetical protein